jgi:hypothetical protein
MFDSTNRRAIREREKKRKQLDTANEHIFIALMGEYNGREWMHTRFLRNHIFSTPFTTDPIQTAFNCGIQNDALQEFLLVVRLCPDEYLQMMREANERDLAESNRADTSVDAERERGNAAEAERIGLVAQRGRAEDADGDEAD